MRTMFSILALFAAPALGAAERINHEGRILGAAPTVTTPTQFNTSQADAIVGALQIMPRDSAWNEDISGRPLLGGGSSALSDAMITMISNDIATANRQRLVVFEEMNYVLVPDSQPLVGIRFITYPGDSDFNGGASPVATWPVPSIMPIETWPTGTGSQTLTQWQQSGVAGDRHAIIVQPGATQRLYETWQAQLTANTPNWQASNGAIFPLDSNAARPAGYTSGDAAGLPMFPALVRYDEVQRGVIEHAMRVVVKRSRQSYIYPASHQAGSTTDPNVPAMGQRVRLKSSFAIPASWSTQERALATALKKYGALVADNGGFFSVSICPDDRWPASCWDHLATGAGSDYLDINNFEIIETTTATGGPRGGTAPTCNAGPDQGVIIAAGAALSGSATGSGITTLWEVYPTPTPPGTVTFGSAGALSTTATFSAVGTYTLRLKASDGGTHTPAYDAVVITVAAGSNPVPTLTSISPTTCEQNSGAFTLTLNGTNFVPTSQMTWTGRANLAVATVNGPGTQLTVSVPGSYLSASGNPTINVFNPAPGGGTPATGQSLNISVDVTPPVISAIAAGSLTTSGATISWTTNESSSSQVDYGLTASYGSSTMLDSTAVTSHAQALSGLTASSTYHFRVRSADGLGNTTTSADGTFTTATPPPAGGGGGGSAGGGGGGGCGLGGALAALLALGALWLRR